MKKQTVYEQIQCNGKEIRQAIRCWKDIYKYGCNDTCYPDGVNLNLIHNHVCYHKDKIRHLCSGSGDNPPPEFYLPTPPIVDSNYFAKPKSKRAQRIMGRPGWRCATVEQISKKTFNNTQMSLF
ncbi:hypothetical protein CAGA_24650 [Caproiciproducens galactitolivorans]|uniref:Uncharacterized protein n=1 Tax=Caproiciproducens galactitolivorans TaxID=642589 RepID=A0A4Z0XXY9_9FIRM|nr:hypothetical protein CAGA_24650 [Caproiciproducens galactitolivorans]